MNPQPASRVPLLIVVSAPSGAGKTTLCANLLRANLEMCRVVTCTTRPARPGEKDGVDYHFLTPDQFDAQVSAGAFLEHATVYGNRYGTLKSEVLGKLRDRRDVLLNIDVQGAANIREAAGQDLELRRALVSVFLTTATWEELESRLRGRGTEAEPVLQKRLDTAREELAQAAHFDYVLTSASQEEDLQAMRSILQAERMRTARVNLPSL